MIRLTQTIRQAQSGNAESFGQIVSHFQGMAVTYAYSILGDYHLAQDAAQEAFIQAYRELGNLREPQAFAGWFRRIVFTQCGRFTRCKGLETVPLEDATDIASSEQSPSEITERNELRSRVLDVILALPENEQVIMKLFYIYGYSHREIAGFLDMPISTVKNRLHTSRDRLLKARHGMRVNSRTNAD